MEFDINELVKASLPKIIKEYGITDEKFIDKLLNGDCLLERNIVQMLEAADRILSTENINTFLRSYQFMKNISTKLSDESQKPLYKKHVCWAIDEYKARHNNKTISEAQLSFVYAPMQVMLDDIFGFYLYKLFIRYCDKMEMKMSSLKTEKAKERRKDSIGETSKLIIPYITNEELLGYARIILSTITCRFGIKYNLDIKTKSNESITK